MALERTTASILSGHSVRQRCTRKWRKCSWIVRREVLLDCRRSRRGGGVGRSSLLCFFAESTSHDPASRGGIHGGPLRCSLPFPPLLLPQINRSAASITGLRAQGLRVVAFWALAHRAVWSSSSGGSSGGCMQRVRARHKNPPLTVSGRVEAPVYENELRLLSASRIAGLAPGALPLTLVI